MAKYVKEFETYIISDKRDETLRTIVPNTEADLYLKIIKQLNNLDHEKKFPIEVKIL